MPDPAVTVCLFTYNQERYVDDALTSLCAQTSRDFEVLVVDDASTDGTVTRIERRLAELPVPARLIVNDRNLGLCGTKNRSLAHCRGVFVCWFAGDDVYEPRRIEHQLAFARACDDRVAVVFADAWLMTDDGEVVDRWFARDPRRAEGEVFDALIAGCFVAAPTTMVRRSVVEELGGFDESLHVDDWDMWLRIADRYEFRYLDECVVRYRLSPGGVSRSPEYAARMLDGKARTLLKWRGRDGRTDALIDREAWVLARWAVARDPALGRPLLRDVCAAAPTLARRLQALGARLPGAPKLLAGLLAIRDAQRARAVLRSDAGGRTASVGG